MRRDLTRTRITLWLVRAGIRVGRGQFLVPLFFHLFSVVMNAFPILLAHRLRFERLNVRSKTSLSLIESH